MLDMARMYIRKRRPLGEKFKEGLVWPAGNNRNGIMCGFSIGGGSM